MHLQIKVWEDRKSHPIAVLRPHDGLPVNSATFLTSPHRPDHIILITGVCIGNHNSFFSFLHRVEANKILIGVYVYYSLLSILFSLFPYCVELE